MRHMLIACYTDQALSLREMHRNLTVLLIFVSPELCPEGDYVIMHSVRSMSICLCGSLQN